VQWISVFSPPLGYVYQLRHGGARQLSQRSAVDHRFRAKKGTTSNILRTFILKLALTVLYVPSFFASGNQLTVRGLRNRRVGSNSFFFCLDSYHTPPESGDLRYTPRRFGKLICSRFESWWWWIDGAGTAEQKTARVPSAGSNRLFRFLDLYCSSPQSGDL